jgi:hypothetical protein
MFFDMDERPDLDQLTHYAASVVIFCNSLSMAVCKCVYWTASGTGSLSDPGLDHVVK